MKIIRSTTCSLKFATEAKRVRLERVLAEYGRVVNRFIDVFWEGGCPEKHRLLKPIVDLPQTWLSARLRKVAAREAVDMVSSARSSGSGKPIHRGRRMKVSSTIARLEGVRSASEFDAWLHLASIGEHIILDLPVRLHRHYHRLATYPGARRLESYIITATGVQFAFEIETGAKRSVGVLLGVDSGINTMAALSTGQKLGMEIRPLIERINRCRYGSKHQKQLRRALKQRIDEVVKELMALAPCLVVVEKLRDLNHGTRKRRRCGRKTRRLLGAWVYRYWLDRLKQACEWNRVSYRSVPPGYSSRRCSSCGHTEQGNRLQSDVFRCRSCGHTGDADVNAACNILSRFLTGPYGAGFKALLCPT